MSREILFRGRRFQLDGGGWLYGDVKHWAGGIICIEEKDGSARASPATVGQYTGLIDKNGKQIFEGDIVDMTLVGNSANQDVGVIEWRDGYGLFVARFTQTKLWNLSPNDTIEVIGNIHDNTELAEDREWQQVSR
jgi:uncharacterized phage protein (TIGR01671 family)